MHYHQCSLCETSWQHGEEYDNDIRAHECPACGCHQFRVYRQGPALPTPALDELRARLANSDNFVRSTTVFSLDVANIDAEVIVPKLAEMAHADSEAMVRLASIETLRRLRQRGVVAMGAFTRALQDPRAEVRRAALFALADLGSAAQSAVGTINASLHDNSPRVREAANIALRKIEPGSPAIHGMAISASGEPIESWQVIGWHRAR